MNDFNKENFSPFMTYQINDLIKNNEKSHPVLISYCNISEDGESINIPFDSKSKYFIYQNKANGTHKVFPRLLGRDRDKVFEDKVFNNLDDTIEFISKHNNCRVVMFENEQLMMT